MPLHNLRILVIDDSPDALFLTAAFLQMDGAETTTTTDERRGIKLATEEDFDVIIVDVTMPGMTGFEVVRELRRRRVTVPIFALTAYSESEIRKELYASGYTGHLPKPLDRDMMASAIPRSLFSDKKLMN